MLSPEELSRALLLTVLREPVARLVSSYHFRAKICGSSRVPWRDCDYDFKDVGAVSVPACGGAAGPGACGSGCVCGCVCKGVCAYVSRRGRGLRLGSGEGVFSSSSIAVN